MDGSIEAISEVLVLGLGKGDENIFVTSRSLLFDRLFERVLVLDGVVVADTFQERNGVGCQRFRESSFIRSQPGLTSLVKLFCNAFCFLLVHFGVFTALRLKKF